MANVSTSGIRGCAAEINSVIAITLSTTNKIQTACNEISNATNLLNSYNGAVVKGTRDDKFVENSDGIKVKQTYAHRWKISGLNNTDNISTLSNLANEVSSIISTVKSQVSDINGIASAIDGYINSINAQLIETESTHLTSEMLSTAYLAIGKDGVAKANLATSGEDINNRNFVNYSDIKDNGLANTKLSFVLQDDGSYKVYSNGEETEFYTTGLAAAFYQKTLKRAYDTQNSNNISSLGELSESTTTKDKIIIKNDSITEDGKTVRAGTYLKNKDGKYQKESSTVTENFLGEHLDGKSNATNVTKEQFTSDNLSNLTDLPTEITVKQDSYYGGKEIYQGKYIYDGKQNYYRVSTLNQPYSTITTTVNGQKVINIPYTSEELNNLTTEKNSLTGTSSKY
ncbi:MAG: hypothetical protein PUD25_04415 [Bacilli bacterium]|nr:hypothetical protein [Bacilli bacterium]